MLSISTWRRKDIPSELGRRRHLERMRMDRNNPDSWYDRSERRSAEVRIYATDAHAGDVARAPEPQNPPRLRRSVGDGNVGQPRPLHPQAAAG